MAILVEMAALVPDAWSSWGNFMDLKKLIKSLDALMEEAFIPFLEAGAE